MLENEELMRKLTSRCSCKGSCASIRCYCRKRGLTCSLYSCAEKRANGLTRRDLSTVCVLPDESNVDEDDEDQGSATTEGTDISLAVNEELMIQNTVKSGARL